MKQLLLVGGEEWSLEIPARDNIIFNGFNVISAGSWEEAEQLVDGRVLDSIVCAPSMEEMSSAVELLAHAALAQPDSVRLLATEGAFATHPAFSDWTPVTATHRWERLSSALKEHERSPFRVLLITDETWALGLCHLAFADARWQVECIPHARQALRRLAEGHFDVVVCDGDRPDLGSVELIEEAARKAPGTGRILICKSPGGIQNPRLTAAAHQVMLYDEGVGVLRTRLERICRLRLALKDEDVKCFAHGSGAVASAPRTYQALAQALADPTTDVRHIGALVERDVALAAKVLKLANSAFFGASAKVTGIARAVSQLGTKVLSDLVLATELFNTFGAQAQKRSGLDITAFQERAHRTAVIARNLFSQRADGDLAFTCALLRDVGELVLAAYEPERFRYVQESARKSGTESTAVEAQIYGFDHAQLGAYLLSVWGLPTAIVEGVALHHHAVAVSHHFDQVGASHVAGLLYTWTRSSAGADHAALLDVCARLGVADRCRDWRSMAAQVA